MTRATDDEDDASRANDARDVADDRARVLACAMRGACESSHAWRDDGPFKRALRRTLRRSMRAFGERAFAACARGRVECAEGGGEGVESVGRGDEDGRGTRDGDARRDDEGADVDSPAAKRARKAEESDATAAMDEDDEIESAATVAAMRRAYEEDVERIATTCFEAHDRDAPFTIQRICELVCEPERYYSTPYKLATAMMKLFAVTQTVDRAPEALERGDAEEDDATTSTSPKRATPPQTKAMERDARDPLAAEQKAFISAAFRETEPTSAYEGTASYEGTGIARPPAPPSPQTVP